MSTQFQIGGQAVIEGVMMRAPRAYATAMRTPAGTITVRRESFVPLSERYPVLKLPVLRGAVGLVEMLVIGLKTLNLSAAVAVSSETGQHESSGSQMALGVTLAVSLVIGIAIFFVTPLLAATVLFSVSDEPLLFNVLAGAVRVVLLLAYLLLISMMKDVKRLFEYHGAEHKAVFAFERGGILSVDSARVQSRFHPRCGTSFLLVVMIAAVLIFSFLDVLLMSAMGTLTLAVRFMTHLPLIPLIGGISFELIKISARHQESLVAKFLIAPGLWLQRITTREPDDLQLEVALAALRSALGNEKEQPAAAA